MRHYSMLVLSLVGAGALTLAVSARLLPRSPQAPNRPMPRPAMPQKETLEAAALRLLPDYKRWTRANKEPHQIFSAMDLSCSGIVPAATMAKDAQNPHIHKYIVAYVNDVGKQALTAQLTPHFPVGSIVVKAKLTKPNSASPELCTVMLKREAGYNPMGGDWEYFVTDGAGKQVQERGKIARCLSCHADQKETDYIFRYYLPEINERRWAKLNPKQARLKKK
jgi:Cytochrome P460